MKNKLFLSGLLAYLFCINNLIGQSFTWIRVLEPERASGWHMFSLPPDITAKSPSDYADLRILAVGRKGDTTEVPYFLYNNQTEIQKPRTDLRILNKGSKEGLFYYTLEQTDRVLTLNEIELGFSEKNFDLKVNLEGSMDQQDWFSLLKDYRITGIKNSLTDFHFTTLTLPLSNYKYYRLSFPSPKNPGLLSASANVTLKQDDAAWWIYPDAKNKRETKNLGKETVSLIDLPELLPVSLIQIHISDPIQFFRPVTIQVKPFGNYESAGNDNPFFTVATATLNSFDKQLIEIPQTITETVKVIIHNGDNTPLKLDSITLKSSKQQVITRLPEAGKYLLCYGNKNAKAPHYDLQEVYANIPIPDHGKISVGAAYRNLPEKPKSWWEKDTWLYVLMGLIILMLGGFTMKLMRKGG